jgi:hypothetical protein
VTDAGIGKEAAILAKVVLQEAQGSRFDPGGVIVPPATRGAVRGENGVGTFFRRRVRSEGKGAKSSAKSLFLPHEGVVASNDG